MIANLFISFNFKFSTMPSQDMSNTDCLKNVNLGIVLDAIRNRVPDNEITQMGNGSINPDRNYWQVNYSGQSLHNSNLKTLYAAFISNDFSNFNELADVYAYFGNLAESEEYCAVEVVFCNLDKPNQVQNIYTIRLHSKNILQPFKTKENNKITWGFGIPDIGVIIAPKYEEVREYSERLAAVKVNGKWGFIDEHGNIAVPFIYDEVADFHDDWRCDHIYYDFKNEWSQTLFKKPQKFIQQFTQVKLNNKWGYVNRQGDVAIPYEYEIATTFILGKALVKAEGKWGIIDQQGVLTTPFIYDDVISDADWIVPVKIANKWGYITRNGKCFQPEIYEIAYPFIDGYALVQFNGKWGYVDGKGDTFNRHKIRVTEFLYESFDDAINETERDLQRTPFIEWDIRDLKKYGELGYPDFSGVEVINSTIMDISRMNLLMVPKKPCPLCGSSYESSHEFWVRLNGKDDQESKLSSTDGYLKLCSKHKIQVDFLRPDCFVDLEFLTRTIENMDYGLLEQFNREDVGRKHIFNLEFLRNLFHELKYQNIRSLKSETFTYAIKAAVYFKSERIKPDGDNWCEFGIEFANNNGTFCIGSWIVDNRHYRTIPATRE